MKKLKKNPKAFWSYASSILNTRTKIDELVCKDGTWNFTSKEVVEVLNHFFRSILTKEYLTNIPNLNPRYHGLPLREQCYNHDKILKKLQKLKACKSPGPGGFPPLVLKETAEQLIRLMIILFKKSFDPGHLPSD